MKGIILFTILGLLVGLECGAYADVSGKIISRVDDAQISQLKSWIGQVVPEPDIRVIDFETEEAREVLAELKLDFIPAVIFEGPLSPEESSLLKQKFNVSYAGERVFIPRDTIKKIAVLELYGRKTIPGHLDLFAMSFCPYSNQAETRLINYIKTHNLDISLKWQYIVNFKDNKLSSLHGNKELRENKRRLLIEKYFPEEFFDYLLLRQKNSYREALKELGLSLWEIEKKLPEAEELLFRDYRLSEELQIHSSPTFLWENKFLISSLEQLASIYPFNQEGRIKTTPAGIRGRFKIAVFVSPKCRACYEIKDGFLPKIITRYGDKIEIIYYDISEPSNFNFLMELEEEYGVLEPGSIPKVFVGDTVLVGSTQIRNNLENILLKLLPAQKRDLPFRETNIKDKEFPERVVRLFKTFSVWTVCWAGLTDGINPCAFTALIFFLSFLGFAGYRKQEVFYLGTFFILSVFITYFLLGLGIFKFILKLKIYSVLAEIFYYIVGGLVFVLGLMSLYDFFRFRKTKKIEDIKLRLPQAIKWRIQSIIGRGYRREGEIKEKRAHPIKLIALSLAIGFIVSILESVCTGQVYLPTIAFITKVPALRIKAIFYLFLYNLMFVIPLVIIFILAILGLTSENFSRFTQRHLAKIKLLTALFFLSLFFLLLRVR